jgi:ABC-type phosphate/phosphonate transport system ATPase subunit
MSESKTDVEDVLPDPDYKARTIGILIVAIEITEQIQVILLGDSAVGKSKLVERFLMDDYNPRQASSYFFMTSVTNLLCSSPHMHLLFSEKVCINRELLW